LNLFSTFRNGADFNKLVDTILSENAKKNMRELTACGIASNGVADVTHLVEQTHLDSLCMAGNNGLLDDIEKIKGLRDKLKKNKNLAEINLSRCGASEGTINAITTMIVDVLHVNTTVTNVVLYQSPGFPTLSENDIINHDRLEPWLPIVLAAVQELVHHHPNNNDNKNIINPDALLKRILPVAMEDFGREKSSMFLPIRNANPCFFLFAMPSWVERAERFLVHCMKQLSIFCNHAARKSRQWHQRLRLPRRNLKGSQESNAKMIVH
jgi:hypothetical protein